MTICIAHLSDLHDGGAFDIGIWRSIDAAVRAMQVDVLVISLRTCTQPHATQRSGGSMMQCGVHRDARRCRAAHDVPGDRIREFGIAAIGHMQAIG
jgi:hypothetical protein